MQLCAECRRVIKLWFLFAIILYVTIKGYNIPIAFFMLLISIPLFTSLGFWASLVEVFTIFLPVLVLSFITDNIFTIYLIPLTNILLLLSYRAGRLPATVGSSVYIIFWSYLVFVSNSSIIDYIVIFICFFNLLIHLKGLFIRVENSLVWSFISENNDEVSNKILSALKEGVYDIKGCVNVANDMSKVDNNIVVLVNAKYSSLNMSFLKQIYKELPKGNGKKVYIIYKAKFFPEMSYIFLWCLLYLKGYKVMGRSYYITYLTNIKTANIYFEAQKEMLKIISKGMFDMADGFKSALPLYINILPFSFISTLFNFIKFKVLCKKV